MGEAKTGADGIKTLQPSEHSETIVFPESAAESADESAQAEPDDPTGNHEYQL